MSNPIFNFGENIPLTDSPTLGLNVNRARRRRVPPANQPFQTTLPLIDDVRIVHITRGEPEHKKPRWSIDYDHVHRAPLANVKFINAQDAPEEDQSGIQADTLEDLKDNFLVILDDLIKEKQQRLQTVELEIRAKVAMLHKLCAEVYSLDIQESWKQRKEQIAKMRVFGEWMDALKELNVERAFIRRVLAIGTCEDE